MKVMGIDDIGKLKYGWEDEVILVTPRSLRAQPRTGSSSVTYWRYRETTPDRAFRKMKDKVRRSVRCMGHGACGNGGRCRCARPPIINCVWD